VAFPVTSPHFSPRIVFIDAHSRRVAPRAPGEIEQGRHEASA
jgi:hypothetical protein